MNGGVAFLYTIPTFQNPTGRTLSKERRKAARRACPRTDCWCSRTTRTASSASRASRRRRCSSWPEARTSSTARPSRRRLLQGCASATSSCRARWPNGSWRPRPPPTSRPRCSLRRRCTSSFAAGASSRTSSASAGCSASVATRWSARSSGICRRRPGRPRRRLLRLGRPPGRDHGLRSARRGRHVRPRLGLLLRAGRRRAHYGSPSATSRRAAIEEGVRRLASAVRAAIVLAARLRHAFGAVNRTDGLCPRVRRNDRSIQFSGSCERPDRRRRR